MAVEDRRTTITDKTMLSLVFMDHSAGFNVVAFSDDIQKFGLEKLQPANVKAY